MIQLRSTLFTRTVCLVWLVGVLSSLSFANADDSIQTTLPGNELSDETKRDIKRWVVELDDDNYRLRAKAQQELEKLAGSQLVYARQQLTEKLSLEYMTRRERILEAFALTINLEEITREMAIFRRTGKSETSGLAAYCRIVEANPATTQTFFELKRDRDCQNYIATVYAAPVYAQDAVCSEIKSLVRSGNRSDWRTDLMALRWISVFLTLCDKEVQLNDRKMSSELRVLTSNLQILSMEFAIQDRQHGSVLRELIETFVRTAGERGNEFAKTHRAALAAKLRLSK